MADKSPLEEFLKCRAAAEVAKWDKKYRQALDWYASAHRHAAVLAADMVGEMRVCAGYMEDAAASTAKQQGEHGEGK